MWMMITHMSGAARSWFQLMAQMTAIIVIVTLTRPAHLRALHNPYGRVRKPRKY